MTAISNLPFLDQLEPNIPPPALPNWTFTLGWWLVLIMVILSIFIVLYYLKIRKKNAYRRHGIFLCSKLFQQNNQLDSVTLIHHLNRILKQVALHAYPREKVASLCNENWLLFLNKTGKMNHFSNTAGKLLGKFRYQKSLHNCSEQDLKQLKTIVIKWIRYHNV